MKIIAIIVIVAVIIIRLIKEKSLKDDYNNYVSYTKRDCGSLTHTYSRMYGQIAEMDWETVKKMWAINPDRWSVQECEVRYGFGDYRTNYYLLFNGNEERKYFRDSSNVVGIILPFSGWKAFMKAYSKKKKEDKIQAIKKAKKDEIEKALEEKRINEKRVLDGTQFVIDKMKIEIKRLEEQSRKQIESAHATMKEVQARLEGEK